MKHINKILLLSFVGLGLLACSQEEAPTTPKVYRPVQYVQVSPQGNILTDTFSGVIEADLDAQLSFRVGGTITKRHVEVGDEVVSGALLVELDNTDLQVAYQQAGASLRQAEANERNQQTNYNRVIELYENNNSSKSDLDAARAGAESAKAATAVARKQLEAARLQLSYAQLKAPQDCSIADILADTNESVSPGQGVVRINCGACAKVKVSVPDQLISNINKGDDVLVSSSAFSDQKFKAKVTEVGVAADSGGAFPVEALLQGECPNLRSGMSANVLFNFSRPSADGSKQQLVVPYMSLGEDELGNFVFVLQPQQNGIYKAERRSVEFIAGNNDNGVEIISGLQVGDLVATAGVRRLLDGMEVKLLDKPILGNN
ncbi:efflux RND transporter periplasmic adaptor subunit [Marinicella sp. W31]|uniref:efflux RND transporter periplasmic adaptor subunit n=1 Tax=Marinicella sp. W31 TaxID=3023713 RepID=UPI0037576EFD